MELYLIFQGSGGWPICAISCLKEELLLLNSQAFFIVFWFLEEFLFTHTKAFNCEIANVFSTTTYNFLLSSPKKLISLPDETIIKERKKANWGKMNIGVGYFVTSKVRDMEKSRELEIISMRNYVVGHVHSLNYSLIGKSSWCCCT